MASADLKALRAKAKYLKTRWPIYGEIIDWMTDLLSEAYRAEERVCLPQTSWDRTQLSGRLRAGKPLFEAKAVPVDMESARDLYTTLVTRTERRRGKQEGLGSMISGPDEETRVVLKAVLACESATLESVCSRHGTDASLVSLLMRLALRPSLRQLSRQAEAELDLAGWSSGRCPVCGSWPGLAKLGEEGKPRTLYCSLCETSWLFPRLKCPFCGNDQPDSLSYVYAEEEKDLRVDLCDSCGQGIGTLDIKYHAAPVLPVLDELVISHLAMAAAKAANPRAVS
jgi:FdhE protein